MDNDAGGDWVGHHVGGTTARRPATSLARKQRIHLSSTTWLVAIAVWIVVGGIVGALLGRKIGRIWPGAALGAVLGPGGWVVIVTWLTPSTAARRSQRAAAIAEAASAPNSSGTSHRLFPMPGPTRAPEQSPALEQTPAPAPEQTSTPTPAPTPALKPTPAPEPAPEQTSTPTPAPAPSSDRSAGSFSPKRADSVVAFDVVRYDNKERTVKRIRHRMAGVDIYFTDGTNAVLQPFDTLQRWSAERRT